MAKNLALVFHPDPRLRQPSIEINPEDIKGLEALWRDMALTMQQNDGIGLAAPQIGQNIRLIIILTANGPKALFNPVISKRSILQSWGEEGCLSIPKVFGDVKRHRSVHCSFLDENGVERLIEAKGLLARVIQHEIDHLDGVLFIDKARKIHTI